MTILYNHLDQLTNRKQLRKQMPRAETTLWQYLKNKQLGRQKFRRQHGVGQYILDFYCPRLKLGIEIDGDSHFADKAYIYDRKRQHFIESFGIKVLRFTNHEIYYDLENVLGTIESELR